MLKKIVVGSCTLLLTALELHAQPQTSESMSFEADTSAGGGFAAYNERYKPEPNTWEVGLFGGVMFPSEEHNIFAPRPGIAQEPFAKAAFELGARLAYFPLAYLGVEAEGFAAASEVESGRSAMLYGGNGALVGQLPGMSLTPFLLIGAGRLGAINEPMGNDTDPAIILGVGVKVPVSSSVSIRLDLRDTMTQKFEAAEGDQTHHPQILLGATFPLGRGAAAPEASPPDSDQDGVPDADDQCPRAAALTPDGCPLDTDGDGVLDNDDHCPREAGDEPNGCPNLDKDGDGVPLPCDKCADEKGVAPDGCPIRDTDGDGFMDDVDKCPDKPETKNGFEDGDGCPDEVPAEVQKFSGAIEGILFAYNQAAILPRSYATLDQAVSVLTKYPDIKIEISGHTSSEGDAAHNDTLSKERAEAVKKYLVDKGIAENRIQTRGAGSSEPVADEKQPGGKDKNRRIEFKILPQ